MSGPVNWEFALDGVGGDKAFLSEVFSDLLRDSIRCTAEADAGINERDFKKIDLAAHEVKGSCLYLGCDALKEASFNLEMVGKNGQKDGADHDALVAEGRVKFAVFKSCLDDVRKEVISKGYFKDA